MEGIWTLKKERIFYHEKIIHYGCYSYTLFASPVSHPFLCQLCGKLLR